MSYLGFKPVHVRLDFSSTKDFYYRAVRKKFDFAIKIDWWIKVY